MSKRRRKLAQFVFVELLLLVGDVFTFARFAKSVALDGASQNDGRAALVLDGGFVGGVDLPRIVAALAQRAKLFVGNSFRPSSADEDHRRKRAGARRRRIPRRAFAIRRQPFRPDA